MVLVEWVEVLLGIVYGLDVIVSDKVKVVGVFLELSYKLVEYLMVIVKGYENFIVIVFYDYLKSLVVVVIFEKYGFIIC